MIYVIADDLTGANDTGVKLSKRGYKTVVSFSSKNINDCQIDVFVVDTETRDLTINEIKGRLERIIKDIKIEDGDIVYKKIDSTMRGNIGAEIEIIMDILKKDICILTPTFPSNNRYVVGGYLIVQDEPLGSSQYYSGVLGEGDASFIPALLKEQTSIPIGHIELKDVIKGKEFILQKLNENYKSGKRIIVIDAIKENHLKDIVGGSYQFQGSVLYSGSAGLASYLSKQENNDKMAAGHNRQNQKERNKELALLIIGSRNSIMLEQVNHFKKEAKCVDLKIDVKNLLLNRSDLQSRYLEEALIAINNGTNVILRPDPIYSSDSLIKKITENNRVPFRKLEVIIRDFIGELSKEIVHKSLIKNVIITGGDTAVGFCYSLKINSLFIIDELLPGVPLAIDNSHEGRDHLKLVTKAGGFGNRETLYKIYNKLINYKMGVRRGG